jgi:cytochrome c biogenesis protein
MTRTIQHLGSLRLTFTGLAWLLLHSVAISLWPDATIPWLVLPLGLLALNLLAAIVISRTFRNQAPLLLFHVGLLVVLVLVAAGIVLRFDGRVEIVEGQAFDPAAISVQSRGWLHQEALSEIEFTQGPVEVQYVTGLRRGTTRSTLEFADGRAMIVGDREDYTSNGYRFMATFNKGFALLVLWQGDYGKESLGAVNFPSYPEFEWKQRNEWTTPNGESLLIELRLGERVPEDGAWTLSSREVDFEVLVTDSAGKPVRLGSGESLAVSGGSVTVADLRLWMGYRVDYDPLLPWLLAAAFLSLAALAVHMHQKYRNARSAVPVGVLGRRIEA